MFTYDAETPNRTDITRLNDTDCSQKNKKDAAREQEEQTAN